MKIKFIWQDYAICNRCGPLGKMLMFFSSNIWWCPSCAFTNGDISQEELNRLNKRIELNKEVPF